MKDTTKWYRDQINALSSELTPENRSYFDDLLTYTFTKQLWAQERPLYRELYAMLQDLLDAQKDGTNARNFFGNDPQQLANDLLSEYGRFGLRDTLEIIGVIVGITFLIMIFGGHQSGPMRFNTLGFVLLTCIEGVGVTIVMLLINRSIYASKRMNKRVYYPLMTLSASVMIILSVLTFEFMARLPQSFNITVAKPWDIFIMAVALITGLWWFAKDRDANFYAISLLLLVLGISVITLRLNADQYIHLGENGKLALGGVLAFSLLFYYYTLWRNSRKINKTQN